jgi:chemotaxis protein MotB
MYTSSQVDNEKFKEISQALEKVFTVDGSRSLLEGGSGVLDGFKSMLDGTGSISLESGNLDLIENEIENNFEDLLSDNKLKLYKEGDALKVEMPENLLFESGKAQINKNGMIFLDSLANLLSEIPNTITVDGHTDNVPIKTFTFESNWHLSVARALKAGYTLVNFGLPESNLSIRGFGSQRPKESNSSDRGKSRNRRIELSIQELDLETPSKIGYESKDKTKESLDAGASNIVD